LQENIRSRKASVMREVRRATRPIPSLSIEVGDYVLFFKNGMVEVWRPAVDRTAAELACETGALEVIRPASLSSPEPLRLLPSRPSLPRRRQRGV
jgi:hypothetical protein